VFVNFFPAVHVIILFHGAVTMFPNGDPLSTHPQPVVVTGLDVVGADVVGVDVGTFGHEHRHFLLAEHFPLAPECLLK